MSESQENQVERLAPADVVTVKSVIRKFGDNRRYLFAKWKVILVAVIIGGAIGYAYAYFKKIVYTAECTFVLGNSSKSGGGMSQYSALASLAGIDVGGGGGLFDGDNITQLYQSRLMLEKTLLTKASFDGKQELLIDKFLEFNQYRDAWKNDPKLNIINFDIPRANFTIQHDSLINLIVADINKNYLMVEKPDKKLSMVSIKVNSRDQLFSKAFTQTIVSTVNSFYIQTITKSALQNVLLLQHQADSVHRVLNYSIGTTASALDANPNPDPALQQVLRVPSQKRQVEVQASTAIYTEVVRNLEIARASLQRETPLIQVIDQPVLPLPNNRTGKFKSMVTGSLLAILIAVICLLTLRLYKGIME